MDGASGAHSTQRYSTVERVFLQCEKPETTQKPAKRKGISKGTLSPGSRKAWDVGENLSSALMKETLQKGLTLRSLAATRRLTIASNRM
jgi:hypothetical protein